MIGYLGKQVLNIVRVRAPQSQRSMHLNLETTEYVAEIIVAL
jgi:hypothetical protein